MLGTLLFGGLIKGRAVEMVIMTGVPRSLHVRHRSFANRGVRPCKVRLIKTWVLQG